MTKKLKLPTLEDLEFTESTRMMDPKDPTSIALGERMQALAERLLGPRFNPEKHQFQFIFLDDPQPNGFIVPKATPPIIGTTRGMFAKAKTLDMLAGYLAHELGHLYMEEEYGDKKARVGKTEEQMADIYSMKLLSDAGFSGRGISDLMGMFNRQMPWQQKTPPWVALLDEHPVTANRISILNATRVGMERDGFAITKETESLDPSWRELGKKIKHSSYLDQEKAAAGFDRMPPKDKFAFIREQVDKVTEGDQPKIRQSDVIQAFHRIPIYRLSPTERGYVVETFDHLMTSKLGSDLDKSFYRTTAKWIGADVKETVMQRLNAKFSDVIVQKLPPIGIYADLQGHIDGLLSADTETNAAEHAEAITTIHNQLNRARRRGHIGYDDLTLKGINLKSEPDARGVTLDERIAQLKRVASWAHENPAIHAGLTFLNAGELVDTDRTTASEKPKSQSKAGNYRVIDGFFTDEGLPVEYDTGEKNHVYISKSKNPELTNHFKSLGLMDGPVTREFSSIVTDMTLTPEQRRAEVAEYHRGRIAAERTLLDQGVKWHLLEPAETANGPKYDYSAVRSFMNEYHTYLSPYPSYETVEHPFAEAMSAKMRDLLTRNPEHALEVLGSTVFRLEDTFVGHHHENFIKKYGNGLDVDPTHPYYDLTIEVADQLKKEGGLLTGGDSLWKRIRFRTDRTRNDPLDESHLAIPRERTRSLGYLHQTDLGQEYAATDLARQVLQPAEPLQLIRALELYTKLDKLPDNIIDREPLFEVMRKQILPESVKLFEALPLETKIGQFKAIDKKTMFMEFPAMRRTMIDSMITDLQAIENPEVRAATAERILFDTNPKEKKAKGFSFVDAISKMKGSDENGRDRSYYFDASTDTQRAQFAGMIAEGFASRHGKDQGPNNSPDYQEKVAADIDRISNMSRGTLRRKVFETLAETMQAQDQLAKKLQAEWMNKSFLEATHSDPTMRFGEFIHETAKQNARLRNGMLNFISEPLSEQSIAETDTLLRRELGIDRIYGKEAKDTARQILRNPETAGEFLRTYHQNFWNAPMVARTVILNDYIFNNAHDAGAMLLTQNRRIEHILSRTLGESQGEDAKFKSHRIMQAVEHYQVAYQDQLKERILDVDDKDLSADDHKATIKDIKRTLRPQRNAMYGEIASALGGSLTRRMVGMVEGMVYKGEPTTLDTAKLVIKSYLSSVPPEESRLLASALIAADHSREGGSGLRVGQTLNLVLSNMGPAGAKLLQAIHSHPDTPDEIRNDLKYTKIAHEKPLRWDVIEWIRDAGMLAEDHANPVRSVGKTIGAGSFGVTVLNTAADGEVYADTLLRPRSLERATREFDLMLMSARKIAAEDPRMLPVLDMLAEAERSARMETKMSLAAKQNVVAEQSYDGVKVTLPGHDGAPVTFDHKVAVMSDHGAGYKRVEIAPGQHFLDIPATDAHYRSAAAQAMVAGQLAIRFAGMPVDRDRHGGNVKIEGNTINHFDFGMMEALPPTDAQKLALGKVVAQAVKDTHSKGGDFSSHLVQRIDSLNTTPEVRNFMAGFKREVLSLGDYMNALSHDDNPTETAKRLTGILGHALYGESTDPIIQRGFRKELGFAANTAEKTLRKAAVDSGITIEHVRTPDQLRIPTLTAEEISLMRPVDTTVPLHLITGRRAIQSGAGNGLGVAMGAYGLYEKLHDENSAYHRDLKSGDVMREGAARAGLVADTANIVTGAAATASDMHTVRAHRTPSVAKAPTPQAATSHPNALQNIAKTAEETVERAAQVADEAAKVTEETTQAAANAAKFGKIGRIAGRAAIPLALAAGGAETYAATRAGDRDRATSAVGGTAGGILGGIAVGAAAGALMGGTAGSVVPGVGTIAVGVVAGIAGGIGGAFVGEAAAKRYASGAVGWLTGIDGKLEAAAKGVDARLKPFLDKNHDGKIDADELHAILKRVNKDSIDKLDKNGDGKLTSAELNSKLKAAVAATELGQKVKELQDHGWGKMLGNKDGKLTLNEVVAAFPKGFDFLSLDKNHNGDISGKEITDALKTLRQPAAQPGPTRPRH